MDRIAEGAAEILQLFLDQEATDPFAGAELFGPNLACTYWELSIDEPL